MSDTIYTKSGTGNKWHIRHTELWTLCYQLCAHWIVTETLPETGEVCQQCQQIAEAIKAEDGIPF